MENASKLFWNFVAIHSKMCYNENCDIARGVKNIVFGYLKINRYELKLKDVIRHKKYYCTLCNDIGKQIGMSFRLFTSFDVTIFLHLFDMLYDDKIEYRIFCPLKPFQKKKTLSISKTALHLCTFLNAYWVYVKLVDDANDSHMMAIFRRNRAKSFQKRRKIKKLFSEYQSLIDKTNQILEEFHLAEKSAKSWRF